MAQHQVEDLPEEVEVECIESLREEEDYFCGKTYRIPGVLWAKYRESFRPVGWRKEQAEQERKKKHQVHAAAKLAQQMAGMKSAGAENLLRARIARHRASLEAKGVAGTHIAADLAAFEGAVRAALWRRLFQGGAA